jgi:hypothetical protein
MLRRKFIRTSGFTLSGMMTASGLFPQKALAKPSDVRKIIPPNLDSAYLGEKILCYRPMRHGSPNMSVAREGEKLIAHNYGHGGSGWTLAPGCATFVNSLLLKAAQEGNTLTPKTPIAIIGAGVIGLFSAYDLVKRGYRNITIYADRTESLTSHNAGGLLAPVSMDNAPEMQATIDQIGIDAYRFFASIARGKHPDFRKGVLVVPTYFENREESGLEPYVGKVMAPAKDVTLDFGNGTTRKMVAYDDGIYMDTATLMGELRTFLRKAKVSIVTRKISTLTELSEPCVLNCAGLGSVALANDQKLVPVQGHLIMLKNQIARNLQYMILVYFGEDKTEFNQTVKRSFYIFPKRLANSAARDIGVVGGTFIEGGNPSTPNLKEFDVMLQGAKRFYGLS